MGNYTAWHYRRRCLDELKLPLEDEIKWLQTHGLRMEKNYQIWHHRRCIAEILAEKLDTAAEMDFLDKIFDSDTKNFHAWSYRVWLIERFQLWDGELDFCNRLMDADVFNNSLWSYRYFLLSRSPSGTYKGYTGAPGSSEFVMKELEMLMTLRIPQKVDNEASWVYLRGLLCTTMEEEESSKSKKIKRVFMGRFKDILEPFFEL